MPAPTDLSGTSSSGAGPRPNSSDTIEAASARTWRPSNVTERVRSVVGAVAVLVPVGTVVRSAMQFGPAAESGLPVEEGSEPTITPNWAGPSEATPTKYTARILCLHR